MGIAVDSQSNIYVSGAYQSSTDDDLDGLGIAYVQGRRHATLNKFDPSGNLIWNRKWEGTSLSIAVDSTGNIYSTGELTPSEGNDWWVQIARENSGVQSVSLPEPTLKPGASYICKFTPGGDADWFLAWGASHDGIAGKELAISGSDIYVLGGFQGAVEFDPTKVTPEDQLSKHPWVGYYLSKFDISGNFKWVRTWGNESGDVIEAAMCVDDAGDIHVCGYLDSAVDFSPGTEGAARKERTGGFECVYDPDNKFQGLRTWDGSSIYGIANCPAKGVYIVGDFVGPLKVVPNLAVNGQQTLS